VPEAKPVNQPGETSRFSWLEISTREVKVAPGQAQREAGQHLTEAEKNYYEGFYEQALRSYARALQYDRGLVAAWAGQVKCLLAMEELEEAETWVNNALSFHPKAADLLALKAVVMAEQGQLEKALAYSDESFNYESHSGYPWLARVDVLLWLRREKTARLCLERVVNEACQDWQLLMETGRLYLKHNRASQAVYFLNKAVVLHPESAYLWYLLARGYQKLHLRSRAKFCCQEALKIRPSFPEAQEMLNELQVRPCFVAGACLGSEQAPEVAILRNWRDKYLLRSGWGRAVVMIYNQIGPHLAWLVSKQACLQRTGRNIVIWWARQVHKKNFLSGRDDDG